MRLRLVRTGLCGCLTAVMLACGVMTSAQAASIPSWLTGVNLSGGELNWPQNRLGWNYVYPTQAELNYYSSKGFKLFRVPLLTGRILSQSMSTDGGGRDWKALMALINQAAAMKSWVIVDIHQFGTMPSGLVGHDAAASADFVVAWSELAKRLKGTPNVIFGLMNEPNKQTATEWLSSANAAIAAIRKAGATQLILVPGSYWDGAWTWTSSDNGSVMAGIKDPSNNYAVEVHQYLDRYSTGTVPDVVKGNGKTSLAAFTAWARAHHVKGFLGEFGFATSADAMAEGKDMLAYLAANKDVWRGWTYWAGGPWWGNYMFSVEPANGVDKPQMNLLAKYK
jgi:endoglucanase